MKKNNFWYTIKYYNIILLALLAIGILLFHDKIKDMVYTSIQITERSPLYNLVGLAVDISLPALWVYITFTTIRDNRYHLLTERYYGKDHSEFQKPYSTLVSFFTQNDKYKMDIDELPIADWHTGPPYGPQ